MNCTSYLYDYQNGYAKGSGATGAPRSPDTPYLTDDLNTITSLDILLYQPYGFNAAKVANMMSGQPSSAFNAGQYGAFDADFATNWQNDAQAYWAQQRAYLEPIFQQQQLLHSGNAQQANKVRINEESLLRRHEWVASQKQICAVFDAIDGVDELPPECAEAGYVPKDEVPVDEVEETEINAITNIQDHLDEDDDANTGAIVAVVIGAVLLFVVVGVLIYRCMQMKRGGGGGSKTQGTILVNSSVTSGAGNQGKLDDIM